MLEAKIGWSRGSARGIEVAGTARLCLNDNHETGIDYMNFYRVKGPSLWGDYGRLLTGGMARPGASEAEPMLLLRTGPFIPPISFPFRHVVVTDAFREKIDASGLFNFNYGHVIKKHIAKVNWERWDRSAEKPHKYPRGGEPEGYILNRWHSRRAAKQMGVVWELLLERGADTASQKIEGQLRRKVMVNPSSWDGQHFFRSKNQGWYVASVEGAEWFHQNCEDWVSLDPCIEWDPDAAEQ